MSELKTNKISPATGTALAVGDSGDTITVPSGATLDISASTLTPPATMPASSGVNFTALNATNLGSGTVPTARLGSGTADATTFLRGDQTYAAATTAARYVYAWLETSHQAVSSGVDTLVQLNGATQSHSAYNTGTYTWTATADDAGIWVFIAQCSVHYDNSNGDGSKTYIYLNDVKSSGAIAWTWTGGTDYLRHYTFSQQYLVSISTSDTIKMYASLTAPSGTINLFAGDTATGPKNNSLLGYKL